MPLKNPHHFWKRVNKSDDPNGCWLFTGYRDTRGYGYLYLTGANSNSAHRISYEECRGPIPEGCCIDHLCRNPSCVNPSHLEAVSPKENVLRGEGITARNKRKTHCPKGHPYDEENTYWAPKNGRRSCKECGRANALAYYYRVKRTA